MKIKCYQIPKDVSHNYRYFIDFGNYISLLWLDWPASITADGWDGILVDELFWLPSKKDRNLPLSKIIRKAKNFELAELIKAIRVHDAFHQNKLEEIAFEQFLTHQNPHIRDYARGKIINTPN